MKIISQSFFLLLFAFVSVAALAQSKPVPLCIGIKKILSDEAAAYTKYKGEAIDKNDDGSENFALNISLEGWGSHAWVSNEKGGGYVEVYKEHTTKAKAIAHYNTVSAQFKTCLGVEGETIKQEGIEKLTIFKKGKSEISLMVTVTPTKAISILTIENAEGE